MTTAASIPKWEIAISVSEPDAREMAKRGVSEIHVRHAFAEISRQLLAAGATLAYGGDFREKGFTQLLISLLNEYAGGPPGKARIRQYLAWPLWETASVEDRAALNGVATAVVVAPPVADAPNPAFDRAASPAARALWADSLTRMREQMTAKMRARVILGGRLTGHTSRFPGVAEEAYIAARKGRPLYILGGFGGCASCLAQVIEGEHPEALTEAYQRRARGYRDLVTGLGGVDWDRMLDTIRHHRVPNGLSNEENELLRNTADLDDVVALVMRGLQALARDA